MAIMVTTVKAIKIEVVVVDFESYGADEIASMISGHRDLLSMVISKQEVDIGDWTDDHPLNQDSTGIDAARLLFNNQKPA